MRLRELRELWSQTGQTVRAEQDERAVTPVFVGILIVLGVVNAVAGRRYRPQTALSAEARTIRGMLAMPVIGLPIYVVGDYLASGRSHGWLAALAPAMTFLVMTEGLLGRLRRARRENGAAAGDGSGDHDTIIPGAKKRS